MIPGTIDESQRTAARIAGLTSLLAIAIVVVAHYGIFSRLVVTGDAAATARNILAHELLYRLNIACFLTYGAATIVLLTALYTVLRPVHRSLALVAALFRLVYATLWILNAVNMFIALRILRGTAFLRAFGADELQSLGRLYLSTGFELYYVGLPFYGLALTVCSYLFLKSRYVPRALAVFGLISSAWCVVSGLAYIIIPNFGKAVDPYWFDSPMGIFEMALGAWLLFKGLKTQSAMLNDRHQR